VTEPDVRPHDDDGESIFALAAAVARRATDGQLVVAAGVGVVAAAIVGLVRPSQWLVAQPQLSIGSFGIWGIAERTTAERSGRLGPTFAGHRALTGVRVAAAVIGTLAGTITLLAIVARAIGTWKT
jgi:hypothetical protein